MQDDLPDPEVLQRRVCNTLLEVSVPPQNLQCIHVHDVSPSSQDCSGHFIQRDRTLQQHPHLSVIHYPKGQGAIACARGRPPACGCWVWRLRVGSRPVIRLLDFLHKNRVLVYSVSSNIFERLRPREPRIDGSLQSTTIDLVPPSLLVGSPFQPYGHTLSSKIPVFKQALLRISNPFSGGHSRPVGPGNLDRKRVSRAAFRPLTGFRTLKPGRLGRLTAGAPGAIVSWKQRGPGSSPQHRRPTLKHSCSSENKFKRCRNLCSNACSHAPLLACRNIYRAVRAAHQNLQAA